MKTTFDPVSGTWNLRWPGRVAQHDLVYLSPPTDPMHGIPLGNGTAGALCWCEGSSLIVVLNRCDLWDDAPFTRFQNWSPKQEELSTTLRHAGRLILDFQLPVFDTFYLSDFEARLNLTEAATTYVSCWCANEALVPTLLGEGDAVLSDSLNHASIIDACRLAGKGVRRLVYKHNDPADLAQRLAEAQDAR